MAFEALYKGSGELIDYTAGADIAAGEIVVVGTALLGVANQPIANGALGALQLDGKFDCAFANNEAVAVGVPVYFDATHNRLTATAEDNIQFGVTLEAVAETATVGLVLKLNVGKIAQNLS